MLHKNNFVNIFTICVILCLTMLSIFYHFNRDCLNTRFLSFMQPEVTSNSKQILIWTSSSTDPFKYLGKDRDTFIDRRCAFTSCCVTSDRQSLNDLADFDVILFHAPELKNQKSFLPQSRSPHQKYVLASMESSGYYPICNPMYNNYFNWTWTYKLNSDENYGYISIRDKEGTFIGPREVMHWKKLEEMMPINDTLKAKLSTKKIAAAWFVSNCGAPSGRDMVAKKLQKELAKYNLQIDIFGGCGPKKCPRGSMMECLQKVETDYYFYLSFENSFADDYVTEKLLNALNHYAVPVVFGGANYTRFMPDGIYLSAKKTPISQLAKEMANAIENKEKYYNFFKWHNHYSYHDTGETSETDPYCKLCALISNKEQFSRTSTYEDFIHWWSPPNRCR